MPFVSALNIYPVKSLAGVPLESSRVEKRGLAHDRRFVLLGEGGQAFTQRDNAVLATLRATVDDDGLTIYSPFSSVFLRPPVAGSDRKSVGIWYNETLAADCGDQIGDWFSELVGEPVRLLYFDRETLRKSNTAAPEDDVSFADQYPILASTEETLGDLNARLENPVPMNRFRPNIVISGANALEEDNWTSLTIGSLRFRAVANCKRCEVTTIDQERGVRTGSEPLRTLASYRTIDRGAIFGRFLVPEDEGEVHVGDDVVIRA